MEPNKTRKPLLYATTIALIVIVIVVAVAITCYSGGESITFPVKDNIKTPYNQAEIVLQYKGKWIGGYTFIDQAGQWYSAHDFNGT